MLSTLVRLPVLASLAVVFASCTGLPTNTGAATHDTDVMPFVEPVDKSFVVKYVVLQDEQQDRERVSVSPDEVTRGEEGMRLNAVYPWGEVALVYEVAGEGSRVDIAATITNRSNRTIDEIQLIPAALSLGEGTPGGGAHHNIGAPTVLTTRTAEHSFAVCNLDVEKPLTVRLKKAGEDGVAEVVVQGGGQKMVYDQLYISRPIAPGEEDVYRLSIRAAPAEVDPHDLGQDVYDAFADAHPRVLDWPDRRPINRLFFRGGAPTEEIIAYYQDPENNPKPQPGDEKKQEGILQGIRRGVAAAKEIDAQGLIIWNIEGGSFPHPTTYIGDPRVVDIFNPDFDAVADEAFKMITDAGLHAGVCIRPTQIGLKKRKDKPDTVGHAFTPVLEKYDEEPFVNQLGAKIKYARDRWGCTIFYVDTNFVWRPRGPEEKWSAGMIQAEVWRKLLERFPDVLIIPEFGYPQYFASVAVYKEYDMGFRGAGPAVRRTYPEGFHAAVIEDADPHEKFDLMVRNVREGNSLMTFAYSMTRNARAQVNIYKEAELRDAGMPKSVAEADEVELVKLLNEGELAEQFYAALALGETGGAAAAGALRRAAADEKAHWLVRKNALRSLGNRKDSEAVDILLPLLKTKRPDLRYFAAEALGQIGEPAVQPLLEQLDQGQYVITALGKTGAPQAAGALLELLEEAKGGDRRTVMAALGMVGGADATAKLTEIMNTGGGYNRVAAAEALGDIGSPEAVQALKDARAAENAKPKEERWGHFVWAVGRVLNRVGR